jgi:uncharacterized protein involved in exopolysaccharide biosynthesis
MSENAIEKPKTDVVAPSPPVLSVRVPYRPGDEDARGLSAGDILNRIFKHKRLIFLVFLIALLVAPVIHYFFPVVYEATSLVLVRFGKEYASPKWSDDPRSLPLGVANVVNSEMSILTSRDLMERVILKMGPELRKDGLFVNYSPEDKQFQALLADFRENLTVTPSALESSVIKIQFRSSNPREAAKVLNGLVEAYMERRIDILADQEGTRWLEQKVKDYQEKVKQAQINLLPYQDPQQILTLDEQKKELLKKRELIETAFREAQVLVKEVGRRLVSLEAMWNAVPKVEAASDTVTATPLDAELFALESRKAELQSKYLPNNPLMQGVQEQIGIVKKRMAEMKKVRPAGVATPVGALEKEVFATKAEAEGLKVRNEELKGQLTQVDLELQVIDRKEKEIQGLQQSLTTNQDNYALYAKKLDESKVENDLLRQKMTSISLVEKAAVPLAPISPKLTLIPFVLVLGAFGLLGGVGTALALEYLRQGFISAEDVERTLRLPVLADFPYRS